MNKKGFTLAELLGVIIILSVVFTIGIYSSISIRKSILEKQYENLKKEIKISFEKYYSNTFVNQTYVKTLIEEGYLKADNNKNIINPIDGKSLNCHRLVMENDKVIFMEDDETLENGNCKNEEITNKDIKIVLEDNLDILPSWYNTPLTLKALLNNNYDENNYDFVWTSDLNPNSINNSKIFDLNNLLSERGGVINDIFYVSAIENENILKSTGKRVLIDLVKPLIKSISVTDNDIWTKEKTIKINAYDNDSKIYGYLITNDDCLNKNINEFNKISNKRNLSDVNITHVINENGNYKICVIDNAKNITKYESIITIDKIDNIKPKCVYLENNSWTKENVNISYGCDDNESGCNKIIYKNNNKDNVKNCKETPCYNNYMFGTSYKEALINSTIKSFVIEDKVGNKTTCPMDKKSINVYLDKTKPIISNFSIKSNNIYNSIDIKVSFEVKDIHSGVKSFCILDKNNYYDCSWENINNCQKNKNTYYCSKNYLINDYNGSGNTKNIFVFVKDNVNNQNSDYKTYKLYKSCEKTNVFGYGDCSKKCGGGVYYEYRNDIYLNQDCSGYGSNSCNLQNCCSSVRKFYDGESGCTASCGIGTNILYYKTYSNYDDSYCGISNDYDDCENYSGCYTPPSPPSDDNRKCISGNMCNTSEDTLYWVVDTCCSSRCQYGAKGGKTLYGYIDYDKLSAPKNCSSYGEPPSPPTPTAPKCTRYVDVGCAGNGHDYNTTNCTCGYGYGGHQCGCKCPKGCVD